MNKKIIKLLLVIIAIFSIGNCYVQDVDTSNSKKTLITMIFDENGKMYVINYCDGIYENTHNIRKLF